MTLSTAPGQQWLPIMTFGTYVLPIHANLIEDDPRSHETVREMANGSKIMLRGSVPGLPGIVTSEGSIRVRIPRGALDPTVQKKLGILRGWDLPVSYCRFKSVTQVFRYDGANGLKLLWRPFMMATYGLSSTYWPTGAATSHATTCTVNGTPATVTLGTPEESLKRVPFTTDPAYSTQGDEVIVHSVPYFYCQVIHAEGEGLKLDASSNGFREERYLRFVDVNGA